MHHLIRAKFNHSSSYWEILRYFIIIVQLRNSTSLGIQLLLHYDHKSYLFLYIHFSVPQKHSPLGKPYLIFSLAFFLVVVHLGSSFGGLACQKANLPTHVLQYCTY